MVKVLDLLDELDRNKRDITSLSNIELKVNGVSIDNIKIERQLTEGTFNLIINDKK